MTDVSTDSKNECTGSWSAARFIQVELGKQQTQQGDGESAERYCKLRQSFASQEHCSTTFIHTAPRATQDAWQALHCNIGAAAALQHAIDAQQCSAPSHCSF